MSSHDIRVLNDLVEITIDSADGYAEAARDAQAQSYSATFQSRASERRRIAARLQHQVQVLGGDAERGGSVLASAHRMFVNLRQTMSAGDHAVVAEVERGEAYIRKQFEQALRDSTLSAPTRAVISDSYRLVKSGHEPIQLLQHAAVSSR
jgi:uncharacterized protein (TIGR02284 family)